MPGGLGNAWAVGKGLGGWQMPGWLAKCLRRSANAWAVGKVPVRSEKCLGGWQCACAVCKNACAVGNVHARSAKMPVRLAIQGFSAGKDLLGNFYRVHGIFSVEVGTNHVSIFLRKNGTSDNNLAPRRFFTQQLDCFFH